MMGAMVLAFYVISFALFCYFGWQDAYHNSYLVPSNEASSSISQVCSITPRVVSNYNFRIDTGGMYEGNVGFQYPKSIYMNEFNNVAFTEEKYNSYMEGIRLQISELGAKAKQRTLNLNLIYMYIYVFITVITDVDDSDDLVSQYFFFDCDIQDIIKPSVSPWFYMKGKNFECSIPWNAYFLKSEYQLGFSFNASEYASNSHCQDMIDVSGWNYGFINHNTLTAAQFDIRTFMVAMGVNLNIYNNFNYYYIIS